MSDLIPFERGAGCRWIPAATHAQSAGRTRTRSEIVCCGCSSRVAYTEAWALVPFGKHGKLPLPSFLYCLRCSLTLDANQAYKTAYGKDREASLPDPVKVARELELNEELSQMPEPPRP